MYWIAFLRMTLHTVELDKCNENIKDGQMNHLSPSAKYGYNLWVRRFTNFRRDVLHVQLDSPVEFSQFRGFIQHCVKYLKPKSGEVRIAKTTILCGARFTLQYIHFKHAQTFPSTDRTHFHSDPKQYRTEGLMTHRKRSEGNWITFLGLSEIILHSYQEVFTMGTPSFSRFSYQVLGLVLQQNTGCRPGEICNSEKWPDAFMRWNDVKWVPPPSGLYKDLQVEIALRFEKGHKSVCPAHPSLITTLTEMQK